tara:strand:- start:3964 stop:4755 length:792 start_codon:yes stop_codon:yes gene_type:complete
MDNFGSYLRNERESRGVPLEEIADNTKINLRFLLALENNDYDQLPNEVFIKGYIRSYAKTIGGNADEMLAIYEESDGKKRTDRIQSEEKTIEKKEEHKKQIRWAFFGIGLTLLIVLCFFSFQKFLSSSPNSVIIPTPSLSKPDKIATKNKNRNTNQPNNKQQDNTRSTENTVEDFPLVLTIETTKRSWFKLITDETTTRDFILHAGTGKTFAGEQSFRITIGNQKGVSLTLNGTPLSLPVGDNVIRNYLIQGSQSLLAKDGLN